MVATQTQIRRDTASALAGSTPVEAELGYDQTNKRIVVGDGVTAGGILIPNYLDIRNSSFTRGSVSGTADALIVSLSPAALSYQTGMEIDFIAASSNTSAVTIDVNSLGVRDIKKITGGALEDLEAGDLISGGYYKVVYNGTAFQMVGSGSVGANSISQGDLNTSMGSVSLGANSSQRLILPGGQYGFYARSFKGAAINTGNPSSVDISHGLPSYVANIAGQINTATYVGMQTNNCTGQSQQTYISSSPPYDLGDGEVGGFFFALVNQAGEILSTYVADAPPWAYNGPTDIRCTHKCLATGRKFRRIARKKTFEEYMDGAPLKYEMQEITHAIKNADMGLIPHPFGIVNEGERIVLLDPMDDKIRKMVDYQNAGGLDIHDQIYSGKITLDNEECRRKCPKGVSVHKMKYKYTKKF